VSKIENLKNDINELNHDTSDVNMEEIVINMHNRRKSSNECKPVELSENVGIFFTKIKKLSQTCYQMVKWMEHSYSWVEERYLRNFVNNTKKALAKRTNSHEGYNVIKLAKCASLFRISHEWLSLMYLLRIS
jgi:ABC-type phosphate transport system ATPase subunit